jgi:hypothetical protein
MAQVNEPELKVGDQLAVLLHNNRWALYSITGFTPSGRIKCGPHYEFNPDLSIRGGGRGWPARAERVTKEVQAAIRRQSALDEIQAISPDEWRELTDDELEAVQQLLDKAKKRQDAANA